MRSEDEVVADIARCEARMRAAEIARREAWERVTTARRNIDSARESLGGLKQELAFLQRDKRGSAFLRHHPSTASTYLRNLQFLEARNRGIPLPDLARRFGVTEMQVSQACHTFQAELKYRDNILRHPEGVAVEAVNNCDGDVDGLLMSLEHLGLT